MFPWMTQEVELPAEASPGHVVRHTANEVAEVSAAAADAQPPQSDGSGDAAAPLPHTIPHDDEEAAEGAAETIRRAKRHKATAGPDAATTARVDVARAVLASALQGTVPSQVDLEATAELLQEGPSIEALATALRLGELSEEMAVTLCRVTLTDRISHTRALVLLRCMVRIVHTTRQGAKKTFQHGDGGGREGRGGIGWRCVMSYMDVGASRTAVE